MTIVEAVTLTISLLAIITSGLSWYESRAMRSLAMATSKAILTFTKATIQDLSPGSGLIFVDLHNFGSARAIDIKVIYKFLVIMRPEELKLCPNPFPADHSITLDSLAPGTLRTLQLLVEMPPFVLDPEWSYILGLLVYVEFTDEATGKRIQEKGSFTAFYTGGKLQTNPMVSYGLPFLDMITSQGLGTESQDNPRD